MLSSFTGSFWAGRRSQFGKPGSFDFPGTNNNFLRVTNGSNFAPGTGDFTVEWWQYPDAYAFAPRPFSIGTYSTNPTMAASLEGANENRNLNYWAMGNQVTLGQVGVTLNTWTHIAIVRYNNITKGYVNGVNISGAGFTDNYNILYNTGHYFTIGAESLNGTSAFSSVSLNGRLTNFHFVKGTALYTTDFTIPTTSIIPVANSKLLLNFLSSSTALNDTSGAATPVSLVGTAGSWNSASPF